MSTLNLPRIREPEPWFERFFCPEEEPLDSDFQNLQWLYIGGSPVVVGYRSKVYSVSVEEVEKLTGSWSTFTILELYVRICDYAGDHAITCMQVNSLDFPTVLDEIKKQIIKFIKQNGQRSTDFYK